MIPSLSAHLKYRDECLSESVLTNKTNTGNTFTSCKGTKPVFAPSLWYCRVYDMIPPRNILFHCTVQKIDMIGKQAAAAQRTYSLW